MLQTTASLAHKYSSPSGYVSYLLFQPQETFTFLEGQFVMIEAQIGETTIKKPYSLATTNRMLHDEKLLGVVVKKTSEKGFSDFLTQCLAIGDTVTMKGPVGHYTDPNTSSNYLFISAGSGLSPNVSLFKHLVYEQATTGTIVNIFGERQYSHIVPELESLFFNHNKPNVHSLCFLSQEESLPEGYLRGHVQDGIQRAIDILGTDCTVFICGKPEMVTDVQQKLIALGVAKEQIVTEKY